MQTNSEMNHKQLTENQLNKICSSNESNHDDLIDTGVKSFNLKNSSDVKKKDEFKNSELFIIKRTELPITTNNNNEFIKSSIINDDQNSLIDLNYKLSKSFGIELNKGYLEKIESNNHSVRYKIQNGKLIF